MRPTCSSSYSNTYRKNWRADLTTCRVHRLKSGLGTVTTSFWERANRVLQHFRVQKTEVQCDNVLEVSVPDVNEADTSALLGDGNGHLAGNSNSSSTSTTSNGPEASSTSSTSNSKIPNVHNSAEDGNSRSYSTLSTSRRASLNVEVRVVDSISKVSRAEWDAVATSCGGGEVNPFLLWSFLHALEESGSAAPRTGWLPQHIVVRQVGTDEETVGPSATSSPPPSRTDTLPDVVGDPSQGRLVACVPLYLKGHSYGEYVFDNSWADFASMLGVRYYPKLQAAVPFTPVTGPRLMVSSDLAATERAAVVRALGKTLKDMADSMGISGVHLTFTTAQEWAVLAELGFKQRLGIQFHWDNNGYDSFEGFLADLKQSKRKSVRQERKSVERAGLSLHRLPGEVLQPVHWDRFHSFYLSTVDRNWGNAYLTREFFHRLGEEMPERVLLVAACESATSSPVSSAPPCSSAPPADHLVAGALNLVGSHALFGRNWGQAEGREYRNLHFELCYYQAIEEAISQGLPRVEAGAQGEHKLQRGYLPSFTYSCHYLRDPRLEAVVDKVLTRERSQIEYTLKVMSLKSSPYKKDKTVEALFSKLRSYNSLSSASASGSLDDDDDDNNVIEEGEGGPGDGRRKVPGGGAIRQ